MSLEEFPMPHRAAPLTLAVRRPGHAVMRHLLDQLDRRDAGDVVPAELRSWYAGALGEVLVGHELARLPEGWHVLHAVPAGPLADIDHLLVGPAGVVVINTKRHPGARVRVGAHVVWAGGGQGKPYQRDLLARCEHVRTLLGDERIPVLPVLVFVDAASLSPVGPQAVVSVTASRLVDRLAGEPVAVAPDRVDAVAALLADHRTWGRSASVLREPDPTPRFLRLVPVAPPAPTPVPGPVPSGRGSRPGVAVVAAVLAPLVAFGVLGLMVELLALAGGR